VQLVPMNFDSFLTIPRPAKVILRGLFCLCAVLTVKSQSSGLGVPKADSQNSTQTRLAALRQARCFFGNSIL